MLFSAKENKHFFPVPDPVQLVGFEPAGLGAVHAVSLPLTAVGSSSVSILWPKEVRERARASQLVWVEAGLETGLWAPPTPTPGRDFLTALPMQARPMHTRTRNCPAGDAPKPYFLGSFCHWKEKKSIKEKRASLCHGAGPGQKPGQAPGAAPSPA